MIINKPSEMSEKEAKIYVDYLEEKYQRKVAELTIDLDAEDEEYVGLTYSLEDIPFERIRRITGYLVGTMDHWNDAKSAEERDRVKHGISGAQAIEVL
jgi:hypothetical protein